MAFSSCSRRLIINRSAISSVKSIFPSKKILPTSPLTAANSSSSSPTRPFSSLSRSRAALGCVHSLLPLHSAVAAARLTSCLSSSSLGSRSLSQGTLCRTSPDL